MRFPRSRCWHTAVATLVVFGVSGGTVILRYWRQGANFVGYHVRTYQYRTGDDSVKRGLVDGTYPLGSAVENLISDHSPRYLRRHDQFVTLGYGRHDSLTFSPEVVAKDGKTVFARDGFCSHAHVFFDAMSDADWNGYSASYSAVVEADMERREAPSVAVAGAAAVALNKGYSSTP